MASLIKTINPRHALMLAFAALIFIALPACQKADMKKSISDRRGSNVDNKKRVTDERRDSRKDLDTDDEKNTDDNDGSVDVGEVTVIDGSSSSLGGGSEVRIIDGANGDEQLVVTWNDNALEKCGSPAKANVDCVKVAPTVTSSAPAASSTTVATPAPSASSEGSAAASSAPQQQKQEVVDNNPYWTDIIQPRPAHTLDIIFVVNTRADFREKLVSLGAATEQLFNALPANLAYTASVIAANDGTYSGELYSVGRDGKSSDYASVMKSLTESKGPAAASEIAAAMTEKFRTIPSDEDDGTGVSGRYGLYSLQKFISRSDRQPENIGLFGEGRSLLVVFISPEDDACASGCPTTTAQIVLDNLRVKVKTNKLSIATIGNSLTTTYNSISHVNTIGAAIGTYSLDDDTASSMAAIGQAAGRRSQEATIFKQITLENTDEVKAGKKVKPESIIVYIYEEINGKEVVRHSKDAQFDPATNTVTLQDAGKAGDKILITFDAE